MRHPAGETITVTRRGEPDGGSDAQGNPTVGPDTSFTVDDVAAAPQTSDETTGAPGITVVTGYALYCPYETSALLPTDRITIRGVEGWQVSGDSTGAGWRSPFDGVGRGVVVYVARAS